MDRSVVDFYKNKNILLTGATGFFGKMILEKLLRVSDVGTFYLLVRSKQGMKPIERIENMFKESIFDKVNKTMGKISNKVHLIEGNLIEDSLGISSYDKKLIQENVEVVFHCGASLNMAAVLREVTLTNVRSTFQLLSIMKDATKLEAFILVSTAYSWCVHKQIEERLYDAPIDPHLLVKMVQNLDGNVIDRISKGIIGKWPNSYAFSKAVAESCLLETENKLPIGLFRPTIVTSTAIEPLPGWTDNLYGPLGIILSQHCGVLRIVPGDPKVRADTVPGDMAVNALLCLAWDTHKKWCRTNTFNPPVLNFSGNRSPLYIPMREYIEQVAKTKAPPFQKALWYPILFIVKNKFWYSVLKWFLHSIPAYILDVVTIATGRKPRMRRTYSKLDKLTSVLRYFLVNEWNIQDHNVRILWNSLNENDKKLFPFDVARIEATSYFNNLLLGLKLYVAKEDMSKIRSHKQKYKRLVLLHFAIKYTAWLVAFYPILKRCWLFLFRRLL